MFEINNKNFIEYEVNETTVYEITDFYKYPDKIVEFIYDIPPYYHKGNETPSFNGHAFADMRHAWSNVEGLNEVVDFLSGICGQQSVLDSNELRTNYFKMLDKEFNTYENNYWWPHLDAGYTALIYLNDFSYPGTNLYTSFVELTDGLEHYNPWQPKSNFKLETTLYAEYNKLVLFDGLSNPHSMAIESDIFCNQTRLNQVIFFQD